ncbi:hypothetical protein [Niabella hibiscisoli]|uniref:hypothetical protein n=1 Tax=Niabella hibiscisoli TaxID=1825928 RepID=UPI001F110300|nr:hypothetical protein [Niabella hibiscisoli]MCH5715357.1 hypothetical protein [Niabella hibiscisoli]
MNQQQLCGLLNRTTLFCKGNPLKADAFALIKEFFSYASPQEHLKAIDDFIKAALQEDSYWPHGSPANGLFYSEQLELLIESAYLINIKPKKYFLKKRAVVNLPIKELPVLLSAEEYQNPLLVIQQFFQQSLLYWKQLLYACTHGALSNSSVAEEVEAAEVLGLCNELKRLVCALSG